MQKLSQREIMYWIKEGESCIQRQEKELKQRNNYPLLVKYYEGDQYGTAQKLSIINDYFSSANQLIEEILYKNPEFVLDATAPGSENDKRLMKSALQYAFDKELEALNEFRVGVFDMMFAGYCGIEVGHISSRGKIQDTEEADTKKGFGANIKKMFSSDKDVEMHIASTMPSDELRSTDMDETFLLRRDPLDCPLDYRAERLKFIRYTMQIKRMPHSDFSAKYPEFKNKVEPGGVIAHALHEDDRYKKHVILYQFQIQRYKNQYDTLIVCPSFRFQEIDYFTRPYTHDGYDLKYGTFHKYGALYPISKAQVNKSVQDDRNNYTTAMMEVADRNVPKRGYTRGTLKTDAIEALNNTKVNDLVAVDGGQGSVWNIPQTNLSLENKELLGILGSQQEKLWGVSKARLEGMGNSKFATELQFQEAGFQITTSGLQSGLRDLYRDCGNAVKDIIVQFWDKPIWLKITGGEKPQWYEPQIAPDGTLLNPLTDILTRDYEVSIDVVSSFRPNQEKKKADLASLLEILTAPGVSAIINSQGKQLSLQFIQKIVQEYGFTMEDLFIDMTQEQIQMMMGMQNAAV